jgi:hypothetical protein
MIGARHPASASARNSPAASTTIAGCHRLTPGWLPRATAKTVAARSRATSRMPLRPGDRGRTGGRGREGGAPAEGAVVGTVTVIVVGELPTVAGFGETEQLDSAGFPVQEKATVPDNPPRPPVLKLVLAHFRCNPAAEISLIQLAVVRPCCLSAWAGADEAGRRAPHVGLVAGSKLP